MTTHHVRPICARIAGHAAPLGLALLASVAAPALAQGTADGAQGPSAGLGVGF